MRNAKIHAHLLQLCFLNSPTESTLYVREDGEKLLIVVLYVDDLHEIEDFKVDLSKTFELTDLGISITTSTFNSLLLGGYFCESTKVHQEAPTMI